jgi:hypothetical protein
MWTSGHNSLGFEAMAHDAAGSSINNGRNGNRRETFILKFTMNEYII